MKLSEISRYWAAKELTTIAIDKNSVILKAPFASPDFTLKLNKTIKNPEIKNAAPLKRIDNLKDLKPGTFQIEDNKTVICFNLKKGKTEILI
jgi:hypothetical protein